MIYGLYLSASGVIANSYKQDLIANNLANSESTGFKRDLAIFQQRRTESQQRRVTGGKNSWSDPVLEQLGGGLLASPTLVDSHQGEIEQTGSALDVAIEGEGYFATAGKGANSAMRLTRDGRFMVDRDGYLVMGNESGRRVLDVKGQPIKLASSSTDISVAADGTVNQDRQRVGQIGVFNVPDKAKLVKEGGSQMSYPDTAAIKPTTAMIHGGALERPNVDPTTELAELMTTQRNLEANANMIRYQDQTLQKLVNEVGKIS